MLAGLAGGAVVLAVGAVLVATGAIGRRTTTVVRAPIPLGAADAAGRSQGLSVNAIYRRDSPGVVFIQSRIVSQVVSPFDLFPQQQDSTATGSGVVLDRQGHILTNAHVIEGASSVSVGFSGGGQLVPAKIVGRDVSSDLAVLRVDPSKAHLVPIPLGDSSQARVGDPVVAIGNPFGYDRTVTSGIVSALQRQITAPDGFSIDDVIQTDAPINPGNSGGPLIDARGRVIGINSQIATGGGGSDGSVGIGFAIPSNTAAREIPQLERSGHVAHPFLGVSTTALTPQIARALNLPIQRGALIAKVTPGSPAAKAGLRGGRLTTSDGLSIGGDVITAIDGRAIASPDALQAAVAAHKTGDTVTVTYYRGGQQRSAAVKLGARP
jgi:S1-C subfamily serine protease